MGTQILTGYTGDAHVTAKRDGEIWGSIWGSGNRILSTGGKLALTVLASSGIARIADGAFIFSKRIGLVESQVSFTYGAPASGKYCKVGIAIRYTMVPSTAIESFDVVCVKTAEANSAAAARALGIVYGNGTTYETQIQNGTVEAYFVLYEFVVGRTARYDTSNDVTAAMALSLPDLLSEISAAATALNTSVTEANEALDTKLETYKSNVNTAITAEQAARQSEDTRLSGLVDLMSIHELRSNVVNDVYDLYIVVYQLLGYYGHVIASPTTSSSVTVWGAAIADTNKSVYFPKFTIGLNSTYKYVTMSGSGSQHLSINSAGTASIGTSSLSPTISHVYGVKVVS